jgi:hypothetical protein
MLCMCSMSCQPTAAEGLGYTADASQQGLHQPIHVGRGTNWHISVVCRVLAELQADSLMCGCCGLQVEPDAVLQLRLSSQAEVKLGGWLASCACTCLLSQQMGTATDGLMAAQPVGSCACCCVSDVMVVYACSCCV